MTEKDTHVQFTCPVGTFGSISTRCRTDCAKYIHVESLSFEGCADKLVPILIFEYLKEKEAKT